MTGTTNCVYETPCGWCSKWDKKCDEKINITNNKISESECEHEWECYGVTTAGSYYRCRKCGTTKTIPLNPIVTCYSNTSNKGEKLYE